MTADDALSRAVKNLVDTNVGRLQVTGKFFVRNPSKDLQRKCRTNEFLRFENEFLHFKNEFWCFEIEFGDFEKDSNTFKYKV